MVFITAFVLSRFIPSCEGQTPQRNRSSLAVPIHPLLRGADYICHDSDVYSARFIPSCEGQTCPSLNALTTLSIHPLLRGADSSSTCRAMSKTDSSPPARGRLCDRRFTLFHGRFIPSCEGQTAIIYRAFIYPTIHPLLRGADKNLICYSIRDADSSPPARGRPQNLPFFVLFRRFIPSCEGQTRLFTSEPRTNMIHPLLRGADVWG